jgi:hypothetical protein
MFAFLFIPAALLLHGFIELMRRNVLSRLAGKYWSVRLSAVIAWAIAATQWREGNVPLAFLMSAMGLVVALWPGQVAHFLANYASEETQVKWARLSGIVGCVMSLVVIAVLLLIGHRTP